MTLPTGKLPPPLLADLLQSLHADDARVLIGPRVGRDAAVIDLGERVLVATSDPITFATEDLGWYAVQVNANDIACMGARPAWMLATLLLPAGTTTDTARPIFEQLSAAAASIGVSVVGGHTEVTAAVDRAIISATMLGQAARTDVITGAEVRIGDAVLLTKTAGIEGTALLAREAVAALRVRGVDDSVLARARQMLFEPGISILRDAQVIGGVGRPHCLHDPTEGGVATALEELATAANARILVSTDSIPIADETRTFCRALDLDPLGLLASGALLAIVDGGSVTETQYALAAAGIACAVIGTVVAGEPGAIMASNGRETPLPRFERDELARYFERSAASDRTPEGSDA